MSREEFLKMLAEKLYPLLRDEGFRGSGTTLRRLREPVVHVANFQGSSSADGFYVNLGAHLAFLPMDRGGPCVPGKMKEYECAFRDRIDPPASPLAGRWPYGRDQAEAEVVVGQLVQEWERKGRCFFGEHSAFPGGYAALVQNVVTSPPHPRDGLKYARVAVQLGLRAEAIAIARHALDGVSEGAGGLRWILKRFLEEQRAAQQEIGPDGRAHG